MRTPRGFLHKPGRLRLAAAAAWRELMARRSPGGAPVPLAPLRETTPGGMAAEGAVAVRLPAFNFPPRGAQWFQVFGEVDVAAGDPAPAVALSLTVPFNLQVRLTHLGFGADEEHLKQVLVWSLMKGNGGTPIGSLRNRSGSIGSLHHPGEIVAHIAGPDVVVLLISQAFLNPVHYLARLVGYYFSGDAAPEASG